MKSYTDLEQSKKLAKILPLESADMCHKCLGEDPYDIVMRPYTDWKEEYKGLLINGDANVFPCWLLAALLDVLPKFIGDYGKCLYYDIGGYYCGYMVDGDFMLSIEETNADNPVDACVAMIEKLHELEIL